jgi:MFS family permease
MEENNDEKNNLNFEKRLKHLKNYKTYDKEKDKDDSSLVYIEKFNSEFIYDKEYMRIKDPDYLRKLIPKKLDSLEFSFFHFIIVFSLGISWVLDGYEVTLLSVLSGVLRINLNMADYEIGLTGSLYLLGCVSGSLFFGFLAYKWGRKSLFNFTLGIYVFSIIMTSFAINKQMFFLSRFLTGVAVGGEYSSIFAAIDELIPSYCRGRTDLIIDGTWHLGSLISAILSHYTLNLNKNNQDLTLRILFGIGAVIAIPVIYLRTFIPESPRWLLLKRKYKEALNICNYIESRCNKRNNYIDNNNNNYDNYNYNEIDNHKLNDLSINRNKKIDYRDYSMISVFLDLFKRNKTKFFYSFILMASQAFFYNGIFYTFSLILLNFYSISKEDVGLYLIPISLSSFMGPILFGRFFDSWSRRKMIALTFTSTGFFLTLVNFNFLYEFFDFKIQQILWFITFLVASPAASSAHLTISEIFPIEVRSQSMAIFFSLGLGVGGVFSPFFFGLIINKNEKSTIFLSYLIAAFVMISAGIFGYFFGVDSENKSLEEICEMDDNYNNCSDEDNIKLK